MALTWLVEKWKWIPCIAVCLFLSGCVHFSPYYDPLPRSSMGTAVHAGTQASFRCEDEILSIASGTNYYHAEFMDEFGNTIMGMVSGLYLSTRDKPERARFYSAYAGLTIYYYSMRINILQIGEDSMDEFTDVEVTYVQPSGATVRCFQN